MVELTWSGKYDASGRKVAPLRLKLLFQTVETVNESAQERQMMLDMFTAGRPVEWRNRLIWGDKKYVLPALLDEFAGEVNLIYIAPPFNVGADFSFTTTIPESPDFDSPSPSDSPSPYAERGPGGEVSFVKEPSILEQKAYRDTWGRGPGAGFVLAVVLRDGDFAARVAARVGEFVCAFGLARWALCKNCTR